MGRLPWCPAAPGRGKNRAGRGAAAGILVLILVLLAAVGLFIYTRRQVPASPAQRTLTRLTFDDGLQIGATWSPDGRFIAYSSDRGGKFDIWVQAVSGGDPVQVTKGPGQNWQPDWSPDGKYIAYRSEGGEGGLYIVPAFGGVSLERKIAAFGYYPRWSPDSSQILFQTHFTGRTAQANLDNFYVVGVDGSAPREVFANLISHQAPQHARSAAWYPDGKRISLWAGERGPSPDFWTISLATGVAVKSEIAPEIARELAEANRLAESSPARDGRDEGRFQILVGAYGQCHLLRADVSRSHQHLAHEHRFLHIEGRGNRADDHGPRARCGTIPLLRWKEAGLHRRSQENPSVDVSVRRQPGPRFWAGPSGDIAWHGSLAAEFVARRQKTCFRRQPRGEVGPVGEVAPGRAGSAGCGGRVKWSRLWSLVP